MGMKLKDFVKNDNLKLTNKQIDKMLIEILGNPLPEKKTKNKYKKLTDCS